MALFTVLLHQFVEEVASVGIEADSPAEAIAKAEQLVRDGDLDWSDGGEVIPGAAAQVAGPVYLVKDVTGAEVWERL